MENINIKFIELLKKLQVCGMDFTIRSYSGRGMYGKSCVAIVDTDASLWDIALALSEINDENLDLNRVGSPMQDSMGLGQVYYWPSMEMDRSMEIYDEDEEEEYYY